MRKRLVAAVLVLSANGAVAQIGADLVHLSARDMPAENGKQPDMTFEEIRRAPKTSLVEVTYASGGTAAPSSMFILKGMCSIAESRGKQYFRAVQISTKPLRFGVTFPEDSGPAEAKPNNGSDKVYSLAECALLNF
jgi:hypothetical protein